MIAHLNFENDLTLIYTLKPDWSNSDYSFSTGNRYFNTSRKNRTLRPAYDASNNNFSTWIGIDKQIDISTQVGNNTTENVNSLRPAYDASNDIS